MRALYCSLFVLAFILSVFSLKAQTPTIDTSFGDNGILITSMQAWQWNERINPIFQADGKIIVASDYSGEGHQLARYNNDGSLDSFFANNGLLHIDTNTNIENKASILLQNDGKILVSISTDNNCCDINSTSHFVTLRFNSSGMIDSSFGADGQVISLFQDSSYDLASANAILPNGKILVAGNSSYSGYNSIALVCLKDDGSLDSAFGNGGKTISSIPTYYFSHVVSSIAFEPDEKIVILASDENYAYLLRYTTNGILDSTFGNDGIAMLNPDDSIAATAGALAVQTDGKIIVHSYYDGWGYFNLTLFNRLSRFNTNGILDSTFGVNGEVDLVSYVFSDSLFSPTSVSILSNGKILVPGSLYTSDQSTAKFLILRLNSDGSKDLTFGDSGYVYSQALDTNFLIGTAIKIQPDGKIVIAGVDEIDHPNGTFSSNQIALARFNSYYNVGITPINSSNEFEIFPNPSSSNSIIQFYQTQSSNTFIRIWNSVGRVVLSEEKYFEAGIHQSVVHVASFPPGIYFISLKNKEGELTGKIVKQ